MPNAVQWTPAEDIYLCRAYTSTSEDGSTGTDQKSANFWKLVHETYMQLVEGDTQIIDAPTRKPSALQSRWSGLIRPDGALFASCLAVVNNDHHSGWTDHDYMNEAQSRFTAKREQLNANALREFKEQARSGTVKTKTKPRVKPEIFRRHHCHDVLRQSVRFKRDVPQPRKRPRVTNELEGSEDEASDNVELTLDTDIADNGDNMVPGIRDSLQSPGQV